MSALANGIVAAIINDLTDRRGLRQEWEQIDGEIQAEILDTWGAIVDKLLEDYDK